MKTGYMSESFYQKGTCHSPYSPSGLCPSSFPHTICPSHKARPSRTARRFRVLRQVSRTALSIPSHLSSPGCLSFPRRRKSPQFTGELHEIPAFAGMSGNLDMTGRVGIFSKFLLTALGFCIILFMEIPSVSAESLKEFRGVQTSTGGDGETEALPPSQIPPDFCCERNRHTRADRSPHSLSPREVALMIKPEQAAGRKKTPSSGGESSGSR